MSFIDQAARMFDNLAEIKFQAVTFGRNAVYLEGAKPVKLDGDEMIFGARDSIITIVGSKLTVKEMTGDCISVVGDINSFTVAKI